MRMNSLHCGSVSATDQTLKGMPSACRLSDMGQKDCTALTAHDESQQSRRSDQTARVSSLRTTTLNVKKRPYYLYVVESQNRWQAFIAKASDSMPEQVLTSDHGAALLSSYVK